MVGYKDSLSCLVQKESPHTVILGDDSQYPIKGMGEASYKLDYGKFLMWSKGKTIDDVVEIGVEEGGPYKLKGHAD